MSAPSFPLITGQTETPGTPVTLALTLVADPDNPLIGDLHLQNGQVHFWDAGEGRVQKIRMILQFFKGEWWLNTAEGIPYFQSIIGSKRKDVAISILRAALRAGLPDLASIPVLNLVLDGVTRVAAVEFRVIFTDGTVINSGDFGPLEIRI